MTIDVTVLGNEFTTGKAGLLDNRELVDNTPTTLYTVPAGKYAVVSVNFANTDTVKQTFTLSTLSNGTTFHINVDTPVQPYSREERTGIVLNAGESLVAHIN